MPKEVIIIKSEKDKEGETLEAWGSLTKVCDAYPCFQYHTIKKVPFPFKHKGFEFSKVKYNSKRTIK